MKRDVTKTQGGWHLVLALAAPLVLLGTGCEPNTPNPTPDAGGVDAGSDAGTNTGTDGGTDGGISCNDRYHDPKIGTLELHTGFTVTESAELPPRFGAVTAIANGNSYALYGLNSSDKSLYALGTWPNLAPGSTPLISVINEPDRNETTFLSGYLTNDGTRLLSGYTKMGADFPGTVVVYDTVTPANSIYHGAPGNFSAAAVAGTFLVNGTGLGIHTGTGVYTMKVNGQEYDMRRLTTFPNSTNASGYTAVSTNEVAVLGYSAYPKNYLHAVPPAAYTAALSGEMSLFVADWPEVYVGEDLFAAAGFGSGVALHRGSYDPVTFAPLTKDVVRMELTVSGSTSQTVTVSPFMPVFTPSTSCTQVDLIAPMGPDLLVGVSDKNGRRLVRVQKQ